MKNPVIKKLLAYVLVGAMTMSTPITAVAAENSVIADAYAENQAEDGSNGSHSGTNTNTNTDTNTNTGKVDPLPDDTVLDIMGLVLDKTELTLEKDGEKATSDRIQARVLFTDYNPDDEVMVLAGDNKEREVINKNLKWRIEPATVVSTAYYANVDGSEDKSMLNVTAQNGGVATITAWIDVNANGVQDEDEMSDSATVTVKEYISSAEQIEFKLPETMYVKHTYNLNDFVTFPTSAKGEKLTFHAKGDYNKQATITSDGILTIKKNLGQDITIVAATEKAVTIEATAKVHDGNPAKAVSVDKAITLDLGKKANLNKVVKATLTGKNSGVCTDVVSWTVKNSKIATVEYAYDPYMIDEKGEYEATIVAKDIGSTTVTAVTSSGKKANIKVTVNATPDEIKLSYAGTSTEENKATIYTGKKPQLSVVSYSDFDTVIPNGKTKYVWKVTENKGFEKNKKATVKNGKVSPHYILADENVPGTVIVTAEIKASKTMPGITTEPFEFTVKQMVFKEKSAKAFDETGKAVSVDKKNLSKVCVGKPVNYSATATPEDKYLSVISGEEISEALDWSASGAGTVSDTGLITATKAGKITLKIGYVARVKGKLKLLTEKYTLESKQKATSLVLASNVFAVKAGDKAAEKVTIKIKQQLPKGAKDTISWKVVSGGATVFDKADMNIKYDKKTANDKQLVLNLKSGKYKAEAGTVIKVGAFSDSGVVAYAYIYVIGDTTGKPVITNAKPSISVGQSVNVCSNPALAVKNIAYDKEPVTYSIDKKGVSFVSVDSNGNIYGLAPGKAKVTVTSASGKKATVTVTVN